MDNCKIFSCKLVTKISILKILYNESRIKFKIGDYVLYRSDEDVSLRVPCS